MSLFSKVRGFFLRHDPDASVRDAIEDLIEEENIVDSSLNSDEKNMLTNILNLRDLTVEDVMIPRAEIIAVPEDIEHDDVLKIFKSKGVMRLPVYSTDLDNVIGYIHISDFLDNGRSAFDIKKRMRKIHVITQSMRVLDLLLHMRSTGEKIALVVDEYGGIDGLVTMGDIVEEIVGDIQDVTSPGQNTTIYKRNDGVLVADARLEIEDLEKELGALLTDEEKEDDIESLGGLVVHIAARVPQRGELIRHASGLEFEIIDADPRRVKRIGIHGTKS